MTNPADAPVPADPQRPQAGPTAPETAALLWRQDRQPSDTVVVATTAPDELLAKRIAHILVEESLVACAHVGAAVTSMYLWQGKLEGTDEVPLTFKTTAQALPALYARFAELHPYEIPEFLVLGVPVGSAAYLNWVAQSVQPRA
ncbi:divalent-cation tolerance protein CutA [Castellaniella caeni]|uniref:divalent-cation tolerance protein CutA n=1 Tax=Castellaniella caeni TaxID=266123 RepID=UPI0009FD38E9